MKVLRDKKEGSKTTWFLQDMPEPLLGEYDVCIRVMAAGVNRADILQKKGLYPPPKGVTDVIGLECSGEVLRVGEKVSSVREGDKVMALLAGGGYAEYAVAHEGHVMRMPDHFSFEEGACFPETFLTAYLNIFMLGGVLKGNTVLLQGASGGVGTSALALCALQGVRCIAMTGHMDKESQLRSQGASCVFDYRSSDWVNQVLTCTEGKGVDMVLDCAAGSMLQKHLECVCVDGRVVVIGLMDGHQSQISASMLLQKRISVKGSTLRSLSIHKKSEIVACFLKDFGKKIQEGFLRPKLYRVFSWEKAEEAHTVMLLGEHVGKLVLRVQ